MKREEGKKEPPAAHSLVGWRGVLADAVTLSALSLPPPPLPTANARGTEGVSFLTFGSRACAWGAFQLTDTPQRQLVLWVAPKS